MKTRRVTLSRPVASAFAAIIFCIWPFVMSPAQTGAPKTDSRKLGYTQLRSLDQLKEAFQRDSGKVRLIALLSPT